MKQQIIGRTRHSADVTLPLFFKASAVLRVYLEFLRERDTTNN